MVTEEEIKQNTILSQAIQLIPEKYPEKFLFAEQLDVSIQGDTIIIRGNLEISKSEFYEETFEFNGKVENYKVILRLS